MGYFKSEYIKENDTRKKPPYSLEVMEHFRKLLQIGSRGFIDGRGRLHKVINKDGQEIKCVYAPPKEQP